MTRRSIRGPQDLLRQMRRARRLTQIELASISEETSAPFAREFIAHMETRGLPGTVRKFLSYAWLTDTDLGMVAELEALQTQDLGPALEPAEALKKCRALSESGNASAAIVTALASFYEFDSEVDAGARGRLLLVAALAAKRGGFPRLARELAERGVEIDELDAADRARAALVVVGCLTDIGRPRTAALYFDLVDHALFEDDPHLAASYWHDRCVFEFSLERFSAALEAADQALEYYQEDARDPSRARLISVRAKILANLGRSEEALQEVANAIGSVIPAGDQHAVCRVLMNATLVYIQDSRREEASHCAKQAIEIADKMEHQEFAVESRLLLLSIAQQSRDKSASEQLRRDIKEMLSGARLPEDLESLYRRVMGHKN